jgi:DNA-binding CsgD family transcriptional regulator
MKKQILLYGLALALLIGLLKFLEYRFIIIDHAVEIYGGLIALFFTILGIWAGNKLTKRKVQERIVEVEKLVMIPGNATADFKINATVVEKLGISEREIEVLQLISGGLSNQEIADRLFVSVNTVKTHISNIFLKLEVSRRTQAVQKAKEIGILA